MTQPTQFSGRPSASGPGAALIVGCLVVAFIVLAVVKPWDRPSAPASSGTPQATAVAASPSAVALASTPAPASAMAAPSAPFGAFTLAGPPATVATWATVRWQPLDPVGPSSTLAHLGSATRWAGGYAAVADDALGGSLLWTSPDGAAWSPVASGTASTFWPGLGVLAVAPLQRRLFALTTLRADASSSGVSARGAVVVAWASSDGTAWAPIGGATFPVPLETAGPPLLAGSGTRLLLAWNAAVSPGAASGSAGFAVTADGLTWHRLPIRALPSGFVVTSVTAAPGGGFLAAGQIAAGGDASAAILRSDPTGMSWTPVRLPEDATAPAQRAKVVWSIATGASGALAMGDGPGGERWWQSADGSRWAAVPDRVPIGTAACSGSTSDCVGSGTWLVAGDGVRLVAVGGAGTGAGSGLTAWASSDGAAWQQLSASGSGPAGPLSGASLMPGGIVLDGPSGAWYGEAAPGP